MTDEKALVLPEIEDASVLHAMALRLQGYSWRECCDMTNEAGIRGPKGGEVELSNLYKRCRPYEKMIHQEEGFRALKAMTLSVAMEATAQVSEALVGGTIPKQSLPIVMGIAVDKYARLEAVEREPERPTNPILDLLAKLGASGGSIKLEVTQPRTVDVEIISE